MCMVFNPVCDMDQQKVAIIMVLFYKANLMCKIDYFQNLDQGERNDQNFVVFIDIAKLGDW